MTDPCRAPVPPGNDRLADLLRQCVQCGLCLPHCATWLATGSEVQSPRGRLLLLEDILGSSDRIPAAFLEAFDQCIGCRACETVCPSGVPFSLLEQGQQLVAARPPGKANMVRPALPGTIRRRLDRPGFLAFLSRVSGLTRGIVAALVGPDWRRRLNNGPAVTRAMARLLGSLPAAPRKDTDLVRMLDRLCGAPSGTTPRAPVFPAPLAESAGTAGPQVAFFRGCANAGLLAASSRRLRDLLVAAGCLLEEPAAQDCCGALSSHTGSFGRAAALRGRNREVFAGALASGAVIVVEAAGCGHELKKYGEDFSTATTDATVLLTRLDLPPLGPVPLKVAYHDPCHARHGQGIVTEPRLLLSSVPELELVEPEEPEVCCGSGGAWGLRYPEMSASIGLRKAENLAASGAELVVTANPGCLGQIADSLLLVKPDLPILPLTDLLWYAAVRGIESPVQAR